MYKGIFWTVGNQNWCLHFYNYIEAKEFYKKTKITDSSVIIYY